MGQFAQNKAVTVHFDTIAKDYLPSYSDESWLGYPFRIRKARALELFDKDGGQVLDVGCGPGIMASDLVERGCDFWGIDSSSEMVNQAKLNFGSHDKTHFSVGAAENLCFADGTFDAVVCMGVIEFVDNDELALSEMVRVLRPGGTLIVAFSNKISPFRLWRDYIFYPATSLVRPIVYRYAKRPRKPHIKQRTYMEGAVSTSLAELGCEVADLVYCYYNVFLAPLEHVFPHLSTVVSQRLEFLGRGNLRRLGGGFIVKATKR